MAGEWGGVGGVADDGNAVRGESVDACAFLCLDANTRNTRNIINMRRAQCVKCLRMYVCLLQQAFVFGPRHSEDMNAEFINRTTSTLWSRHTSAASVRSMRWFLCPPQPAPPSSECINFNVHRAAARSYHKSCAARGCLCNRYTHLSKAGCAGGVQTPWICHHIQQLDAGAGVWLRTG